MSNHAFYLSKRLLRISCFTPPVIYGHYVYFWLDNGAVFYIGSGTKRRAWNEHTGPEERIRVRSSDFKVRIYKHGLTKKRAHITERYLIHSMRNLLVNRKKPLKESLYACPDNSP